MNFLSALCHDDVNSQTEYLANETNKMEPAYNKLNKYFI